MKEINVNDSHRKKQYHEHLLIRIMEAAHDAVVLMNDKGSVTGWNSSAERIFGYTQTEAMGQDLHELLCRPEERIRFEAAFREFNHAGTGPVVGKTIELEAVDKWSKVVPIELSVSSFCVDDQWHSMGIVRDITERKAVEETLLEAKEEAERANAVRSSFIANMSHELRTPLHGMIGMQSLMERTDLDAEQRECLHYMKEASAKLLQLVEDLLDMSNIDKGVKSLNEESFYFGQELAETMVSFQKMAEIKGLNWNFSENPLMEVMVRGDRAKLIRSVCHLMTNAIKFTSSGKITLKTELKSIHQDTGIFSFSVKDTGIGIAEKDQDHLFDAFYQRDTSTTRHYEGTGVGLSLVKRFIEMMGGSIHFTSELNSGSEFTLELPLKIIEIDPALLSQVTVTGQNGLEKHFSRSMKILVAEDDRSTRVLMEKLLKSLDIQSDLVENGLDAVQYYLSRQYDLVLLDIQMPVMDGFETAQMIREYEKETDRRTPVVALTAYSTEYDRQRCFDYGMDDVLTKPVDLDVIYGMIAKWTNEKTDASD